MCDLVAFNLHVGNSRQWKREKKNFHPDVLREFSKKVSKDLTCVNCLKLSFELLVPRGVEKRKRCV